MPFGEELAAGVGGRTTAMGFPGTSDGLRQKFTQYERDNETGLDYAQARYYGNVQGRFTSVDPYNINMERQYEADYEQANKLLYRYITNPLRWNRYAYALNNPIRYVDPTGETDEEIVVQLNIVYDKDSIGTEEAAKKLTATTVADATKTYATAGIRLEVTYTAGSASTTDTSDVNQSITEGKKEGALNVFVSNDMKNHTGGRSDVNTGETFINYGRAHASTIAQAPEKNILAHELGHQFGVNNSSFGNFIRREYVIDGNNYLLEMGLTTVRTSPHITRGGILGPERPKIIKNPIIDVYRNGARRFAKN
jgi:RHS repeat-associated protein